MFIYLDNNATTLVVPEVVAAMEPYWGDKFGNAGSPHKKGVGAALALKEARRTVAGALGADEREIIFTSGATEAANMAIKGTLLRSAHSRHVVTTQVEHDATLKPLRSLEMDGHEVVRIAPDEHGRISPNQVVDEVTDETRLVAIMHVNNELGTRYSISDIAAKVKGRNPDALVFVDGVQAFGKIPVDLTNIDFYSMSAHKIHGPKGVGALFVREGTPLVPLIEGGGQEFGLRSGTENIPGIVGFAKAVELALDGREEHLEHVRELNELLREELKDIEDYQINTPDQAVPYTLNVAFPPAPSEVLLHAMEDRGVYISAGSACAGSKGPSHVLRALPIDEDIKKSSVRFGFSRINTKEEVKEAAQALKEEVAKLRQIIN